MLNKNSLMGGQEVPPPFRREKILARNTIMSTYSMRKCVSFLFPPPQSSWLITIKAGWSSHCYRNNPIRIVCSPVQNSPLLDPILSQISPLHSHYLLRTLRSFIPPHKPTSTNGFFLSGFLAAVLHSFLAFLGVPKVRVISSSLVSLPKQ